MYALCWDLGCSRSPRAETVAPRFGRLLTLTLAAGAGNDFLQAAFAALCARSELDIHPFAKRRLSRN